MNIPHLRMDATYGKIGIESRDARLAIHQQRAQQSIRQPKAELTIRTVPGRMNIDQSQAFAEAGLKSVFQLIDEFADRGRQAVLEGVGRRSEQGDQLMKIENKGNPIAEQARVNHAGPPVQFNIGWMPKSPFSVKFDYRPAELHISWDTHQPEIETIPRLPEYTYTPGDVRVYMRQWPSLKIDVVGANIDQQM